MTTILFELGTEELPPKSLKQLQNSLSQSVHHCLDELGIGFGELKSYAAPRRLALQITDIASHQADRTEQKKGPAIKAAFDANGQLTRAGQGFLQGLNATGLNLSQDDLITISDKKGDYIGYDLTIKGQATSELLPSILQQALDSLPIAKRMRSGAKTDSFVRPVKWLVLMADDKVISARIQGLTASNQTLGHRFHAPNFHTIAHASDYEAVLENAFVIADFAKRQQQIRTQVHALANEVESTAIMPDELLEEVTALVDYPVVMRAGFEERFLAVPQEALISTMQDDQKYFCLTKEGVLQPYFIFVSNISSKNPQAVVLGNEKVVRPRLADAEFFFLQDQKQPLFAYTDALKTRIFQDKLGTLWEKGERIAKLSAFIATQIGADVEQATRAGLLAKADLATTLVGEFPKLQGVAGSYYAHLNNEPKAVSDAISEQYLPKFSGDVLPNSDIGVCLALADRLDTLVGIFGIGQIPTGSKDPFSLRRSAIGVLRILIEKKLMLNLVVLVEQALLNYGNKMTNLAKTFTDVMDFINARYRAMYEEMGIGVDNILAVQAINPHMPMDFDDRVRAVQSFRQMPTAKNLSDANKRVANILAKSDVNTLIGVQIDEALLTEAAEIALYQAINDAKVITEPMAQTADYEGILRQLESLSVPLMSFFDTVMVNSDDEKLKQNRLVLLQEVRRLFLSVADISVLQM